MIPSPREQEITQRLYHSDAYLREFDAHIVRRLQVDGRPAVVLDRTAFYPGGGGQPHDRGELEGVAVIEVQADDDLVLHLMDGQVASDVVHGSLNWERRFDHMQQHTGQHILSQAMMRTHGAQTVSFHLGQDACTIDVDRAPLSVRELGPAERLANRVISENHRVICAFASPHVEPSVPLRRHAQVVGPMRLVQISDFDASACGGTHVSSSAEVGILKVTSAERHRGGTTRVTFLCGRRALDDYGRKHELVRSLAAHFSTGEADLLPSAQRLSEELKHARRAERLTRDALIRAEAQRLCQSGRPVGEVVIVEAVFDDKLWAAADVAALATELVAHDGCVALLGWAGEKPQLTFARAANVSVDMAMLMGVACRAIGGRGGGRPEWAQGGGPTGAPLARALLAATEALALGT